MTDSRKTEKMKKQQFNKRKKKKTYFVRNMILLETSFRILFYGEMVSTTMKKPD